MMNANELLTAVEKLFAEQAASEAAVSRETQFVAGRVLTETLLVVLFLWQETATVFGALFDTDELAALFEPHDVESLADAVVSNDLAGPPGAGMRLDADWADGLVSAPHDVQWVLGSERFVEEGGSSRPSRVLGAVDCDTYPAHERKNDQDAAERDCDTRSLAQN
ncbi:hypothetical protein AB0O95_00670 [Rhodoglobus sp. NPDC076762]